uniref:KIND domain-containing protein n=1 Tax=Salarias fasciatus TaxID=181472 RepID=A0A672G1G6_SALFA
MHSSEVLEARGGPLLEEEVWSLLLGTAESLVDVSYKGKAFQLPLIADSHTPCLRGHNNMCSIISPTSLLLSATGTLAFKNCGLSDEVSTFTAPEMLQGRASSTKPMLVYSLGMTLYWSVDFQLPQNQPVQLSDHLNSLLLSMCEDVLSDASVPVFFRQVCDKYNMQCRSCSDSSTVYMYGGTQIHPPPFSRSLISVLPDILSLFDFSNLHAQLFHIVPSSRPPLSPQTPSWGSSQGQQLQLAGSESTP